MRMTMNDSLIEQYREIAKENPDDDLSQFALGQALLNANRPAEAVPVLRHVIRINPKYTKAYILLGKALEADEDEDGAIEAWQLGYHASNKQGTLMNAQEARTLLEAKGAPLSSEIVELLSFDDDEPEESPEDAQREPTDDEVRCIRSGRIGQKMIFDPFDDQIGAFIMANVSQESWDAWMEMSIKVINELRLDLGDPKHQDMYEQHMRDFLNLPAELFDTENK
jgi:Fe-S cluster biosynthesis and repair protein YggX